MLVIYAFLLLSWLCFYPTISRRAW